MCSSSHANSLQFLTGVYIRLMMIRVLLLLYVMVVVSFELVCLTPTEYHRFFSQEAFGQSQECKPLLTLSLSLCPSPSLPLCGWSLCFRQGKGKESSRREWVLTRLDTKYTQKARRGRGGVREASRGRTTSGGRGGEGGLLTMGGKERGGRTGRRHSNKILAEKNGRGRGGIVRE